MRSLSIYSPIRPPNYPSISFTITASYKLQVLHRLSRNYRSLSRIQAIVNCPRDLILKSFFLRKPFAPGFLCFIVEFTRIAPIYLFILFKTKRQLSNKFEKAFITRCMKFVPAYGLPVVEKLDSRCK